MLFAWDLSPQRYDNTVRHEEKRITMKHRQHVFIVSTLFVVAIIGCGESQLVGPDGATSSHDAAVSVDTTHSDNLIDSLIDDGLNHDFSNHDLVENLDSTQSDATSPDAALDALNDSASSDASSSDAKLDSALDTSVDTNTDGTSDVKLDTAQDTATDTKQDTATDTAQDTTQDLTQDIAQDVKQDTATDTAQDTIVDSATDAATTCNNTLVNSAFIIDKTWTPSSAPVAKGGTILEGIYNLVSWTQYQSNIVNNNPPTRQRRHEYRKGYRSDVVSNNGGTEIRQCLPYSTQGTTLTVGTNNYQYSFSVGPGADGFPTVLEIKYGATEVESYVKISN